MENEAIKSMLNPVRIKIIQEIGFRKEATTKEISEILTDVPQATLYRHIANLVKNKILVVSQENQVRGIIEKVYKVNENLKSDLKLDAEKLSIDDLSRMFIRFILELLVDFDRCAANKKKVTDLHRKIGFTSTSIYLSDDELAEMMTEVSQVYMKRFNNEKTDKRELRKISNIVSTSQNC